MGRGGWVVLFLRFLFCYVLLGFILFRIAKV